MKIPGGYMINPEEMRQAILAGEFEPLFKVLNNMLLSSSSSSSTMARVISTMMSGIITRDLFVVLTILKLEECFVEVSLRALKFMSANPESDRGNYDVMKQIAKNKLS